MRGDDMKFAEIEYSDGKNSRGIDWFNSVFRPYSIEEIASFGAEGYRISVNLSQNAEEHLKKRVFEKVGVFLNQNEVETQIGIPLGCVHYADGNLIGILGMAQNLKPNSETVIIEGEPCITETAIAAVCPKVKYISLLCRDTHIYKTVWEYYFNEYGINIQLINSFRHQNFLNADTVIDCKNLNKRYSRFAAKENALYAADERLRFLSDKNVGIKKRSELIENMDLTALTSN